MKQAIPSSPLRLLAVACVLLLASAPVLAVEQAGRVLVATGTVVATTDDGSTRVLSTGSRVFTGDLINTRDGRIQIRFIDGALVSLESNTRFEVEDYSLHDAGSGTAEGGGNVIMSLFQGLFRTITGAIGDDEEETYELNTPVATVGIRGTQYSLQFCREGACGAGVNDGLYGYIGSGQIVVSNAGGREQFRSGVFFHVSGPNDRPQPILRPPGQVLSGDEPGEGEGEGAPDVQGLGAGGGSTTGPPPGSGGDGTGGEPVQFSESDDTGVSVSDDPDQVDSGGGDAGPTLTDLDNALVASGFLDGGLSEGGVCLDSGECTAKVDDNGNLVFVSESQTFEVSDTATLAESGTVASLDAVWGRWVGTIDVDGSPVDGFAVWAYSTNPTTLAELDGVFAGSGTLEFSLADGPSPVGDLNGDLWSVDSFTLDMDFNGGTATIGSADVNLVLIGPTDSMNLSNFSSTVTIDPGGSGDTGFVLLLQDSLLEDDATLEAAFAGDLGEGLLIQFEANNFDSSGSLLETIQGVSILGLDRRLTDLQGAHMAVGFIGGGIITGGECFGANPCTAQIDESGNVVFVDGPATFEVTDSASLVESGTVPSLDALWGRWSGDILVDGSTVNGDLMWAYSTNPTTAAALESAFSGEGTLSFSLVDGPSPVGDQNGDMWKVDSFDIAMSFSGGTATISGSQISLALSGPENILLDTLASSVIIDPGSGDVSFSANIGDADFVDDGFLEAIFAGSNGEGLLAEFQVRNFDSSGLTLQETIEGVKILEQP